MMLFVGLGNPGKSYVNTRHNVGFLVIDKLTDDLKIKISHEKKLKSELAKGAAGNKHFILAKPDTYMNDSGSAVVALKNFYKIKNEDIHIIHDDKDIELGEYKQQTNRGAAGHNGVQSIIDSLGTKNFNRIRIGIKPKKQIGDTANFVLGKLSSSEKKLIEKIGAEVTKKIEKIIGL